MKWANIRKVYIQVVTDIIVWVENHSESISTAKTLTCGRVKPKHLYIGSLQYYIVDNFYVAIFHSGVLFLRPSKGTPTHNFTGLSKIHYWFKSNIQYLIIFWQIIALYGDGWKDLFNKSFFLFRVQYKWYYTRIFGDGSSNLSTRNSRLYNEITDQFSFRMRFFPHSYYLMTGLFDGFDSHFRRKLFIYLKSFKYGRFTTDGSGRPPVYHL